jgi:glycosyltransferase involved in cell wall biosynthesis
MRVHVVELEGRGGPFQHAVSMADALYRDGLDVVLHTATDLEFQPAAGVPVCHCMDWLRDVGWARRPRIAARYLAWTLPHLLRATRTTDTLHFHGPFKAGLLAASLAAARVHSGGTAFSPHNTFSRQDRRVDAAVVRWSARRADVTIVYSEADAETVRTWGARPVVSFLLQNLPPVDDEAVARWRSRWDAGRIVLFAGQIRRDKRLDLLIAASLAWRSDARLAVVGRDAGDAERCRSLAERIGADVDWTVEYVPLKAFVAALVGADVVVCPYARASQSGILAAAAQLGIPSVATAVGGLGELATVTVPSSADAPTLAQAIDRMLGQSRPVPLAREAQAVAAHRRAYGLAVESRR